MVLIDDPGDIQTATGPAYESEPLTSLTIEQRGHEITLSPAPNDAGRGGATVNVKLAPDDLDGPLPAGKVVFTCRAVRIEDSRVYNAVELAGPFQGRLGQAVTRSDAHRWADQITARYREAGYVYDYARVADTRNGQVLIRVVEHRLGKVSLEGRLQGELPARLSARLRPGTPVNLRDIERQLLLINDLPGTSAAAVLRPGGGRTIDLIIRVAEEPTVTRLTIDNWGTRHLGPFEVTAQSSARLLPYHETTAGVVASLPTHELRAIRLGHRRPIGHEGTFLSVVGDFAETAPGFRLHGTVAESQSLILKFAASHPVVRTPEHNLSLDAEFAGKNIEAAIFGTEVYEDRVRTISLGATFDSRDHWGGTNEARLVVTKGIGGLGASRSAAPNLSRPAGRADYAAVTASLVRNQAVNNTISIQAAAAGQLSRAPLLLSEQFAYGGQEFGRAYDPAEFPGDSGVAGLVELRWYGVPRVADEEGHIYLSTDIGTMWDAARLGRLTAASAAAGYRVELPTGVTGQFSVAVPLLRPAGDPGHGSGYAPRGFFSLGYQF